MKDLEAGFAEVEKRVKALNAENSALRGRVRELEQELAQARRESRDLEHFHGKRMHIKEKVERILNTLEAIEAKKEA